MQKNFKNKFQGVPTIGFTSHILISDIRVISSVPKLLAVNFSSSAGKIDNAGAEEKKDIFNQWFVGFSEGEGCFKIKPKYRTDKSKVHSFSFEFEIHLHIDDKNLLYRIRDSLGVGAVYLRETRNSCSFIVGSEKGIRILLAIFDKYKLNGIKYLDYLDFKKAFNLYFDRTGTLTDEMRTDILELYNGINTGRNDFNMPSDHEVKITPY
jgi:hypothetical protein